MDMGYHPYAPDSSFRSVSPAGTGSQITLYQQLIGYTIIRISDRLSSFPNNTINFFNQITNYQLILVSEYSPDDSHNNTLSQIYTTSTLLENARETAYLRVSPQGSPPVLALISRNDARLLGDLDPPTVDYAHDTPIPTTVAHTNRQYRPITTQVYNDLA